MRRQLSTCGWPFVCAILMIPRSASAQQLDYPKTVEHPQVVVDLLIDQLRKSVRYGSTDELARILAEDFEEPLGTSPSLRRSTAIRILENLAARADQLAPPAPPSVVDRVPLFPDFVLAPLETVDELSTGGKLPITWKGRVKLARFDEPPEPVECRIDERAREWQFVRCTGLFSFLRRAVAVLERQQDDG